MTKIAPSILAADPLRMHQAGCLIRDTGADELHFDVMDGHFVPNISFGPSLLKAMKKEFSLFADVHLMLTDPIKYVEAFAAAGADNITIHQEANDFVACLEKIRNLGVQTGASLKPATPAESLREVLPLLDRVLLMTVEPGFGGQKLMRDVLGKAAELRLLGFRGDIQADGGINAENAAELAQAGITNMVMGTAFFGAENPGELVNRVHTL